MMKKCFSIILSFVMCVSIFSNTVFAVNGDTSRSLKKNYLPNTIYVSINEDGRYIDSNQENGIKGEMTKEMGIYALEDGTLLSHTGTENYQQVEKITMSLTDTVAINDLFDNYTLAEEVKEDLLEKSQTAIKNDNQDAIFSLIVPYQSMARGTYNVDYTYNGKPMRDTFIYYYSINTGMNFIKKGTGGRDFANLTSDIILIGAGFAMTPVALCAGGISLLKLFTNLTNTTVISGHTEDFIQLGLNYDVSTKWTYCDIGNGWQLGLISQNVYMNKITTSQYYFRSSYGTQYDSVSLPKKTTTSPSFNNAAPVAFTHINNPKDERMKSIIGDKTFVY